MKIKCAVIEDLLPLYIDEVCSEESKILVEEHLKECGLCTAKFIAQKKEIVLDNNAIKENMKAAEPFKKISKFYLKRLIAILVAVPLLLLSLIEIRGDGLGFSALYGRYKTQRFLSLVEKGQFERAAKEMAYNGGRYVNIENKVEAKKQWIAGMENLKKEGIEIISHRQNSVITDDTFTSGYVIVTVGYEEKSYDFLLFISTDSGKVELGSLSADIKNGTEATTEVERLLIEKISEIISTYYPG
jgi:hypothetical protein